MVKMKVLRKLFRSAWGIVIDLSLMTATILLIVFFRSTLWKEFAIEFELLELFTRLIKSPVGIWFISVIAILTVGDITLTIIKMIKKSKIKSEVK
jgi:hypothetical protein